MNDEIRRGIVLLCTCMNYNKEKKIIFDYQNKRIYHYNIQKDSIRYYLFDLERNSIIQGNSSQLFDSKSKTFYSLKIERNKFIVFESNSNTFIYGLINNNNIVVSDIKQRKQWLYSIIL